MDASKLVKAIIIGVGTVCIMASIDFWKAENEEKRLQSDHNYEQANKVADFIKSNPTKGNLKDFRSNYPYHPFADKALVILDSIIRKENEDALWYEIETNPTEYNLVEFIGTYRGSERINLANEKLKKIRYRNLNDNLSPESLDNYLSNYPDEDARNKLCLKLDSLYWKHASAEETEYFFSRYLHSFTGICTCKKKGEAIAKINSFKDEQFDQSLAIDKTFKGIISQNGLVETLIVQFKESHSGILTASYNIGNNRKRELNVNLIGSQFILEKEEDDGKQRYLQGYFYFGEPYAKPFIETSYLSNGLYWRADIYKTQ